MRRLIVPCLAALFMLSACAPAPGGAGAAPTKAVATPWVTPDVHAAILIAALRRYLTTPGENSFPDPFANVYLFDYTDPRAADPMGSPTHESMVALPPEDQSAIVDGLADVATVRFVADRAEVVVTTPEDRCGAMPDGAILVTLGEPVGTADRVEVGISGWVSCLGATWLTYVVERDGGQWRVTGTTGSMAIA